MLNRRNLLVSGSALGAAALTLPRMAFAQAATEKRLLFILQRGAADGLATITPMGDPDYVRQRGRLIDGENVDQSLDGFFNLHPALTGIGNLYLNKEALFVHATACSHRERSHFDAQNLLESGGPKAYETRDGWLNRMLALLPKPQAAALALAPVVPLALQGPQQVSSYAPSALPDASEDLMQRVSTLYGFDPQLDALWKKALQTREMAGDTELRNLRNARAAGTLAASLMTGPDSARVMMVETNGWDSHAGQPGQLNRALQSLDGLVSAYRDGMGEKWQDTMVLVATEFGRTVAVNGTNGTDHGTASAAMVLGGSVKGGRVLADWPGLRAQDLYEGRDLMPTTSLEAVLASSVAQHFALDPTRALATLFPGRALNPIGGLA